MYIYLMSKDCGLLIFPCEDWILPWLISASQGKSLFTSNHVVLVAKVALLCRVRVCLCIYLFVLELHYAFDSEYRLHLVNFLSSM